MKTFKTNNGLLMLACLPLSFQVESTYRDGTGDSFYSIHVGSFSESYMCTYIPKEGVLRITNTAYSSDALFKFKVDSFETASKLVLSFTIGMGLQEDMRDTIYMLQG